MHDGVGALLTAAGIQISSLAREAKQGETVSPDDLEKTSEFVRQAAEEARALSHGLSPVEMEEGFCSALEKMADRMDGQKEVECTFEADGGIDESGIVSEEVARHLYRIAQEALNNAIKHAEPDQIQIRVARIDDETLELAVEDDGVGFSPCSDEEGIGLRTMRRRAALIDGSFAVEEGSDGGTIVRCRVPLGAPRR